MSGPSITTPTPVPVRAGALVSEALLLGVLMATAWTCDVASLRLQALFGGVVLAVDRLALAARARQTRDHLEFGAGKVKSLGMLAVAAAMIVAGSGSLIGLLLGVLGPEAEPRFQHGFELAFAAVVHALYALAIAVLVQGFTPAGAPSSSAERRRRRARTALCWSLLSVQVALTLAVLARDPAIVLLLDSGAAASVALIVLGVGIGWTIGSLREVTDCAWPAAREGRLRHVSHAAGIKPHELIDIRSREDAFGMTVDPTLDRSSASVRTMLVKARREIETKFAPVTVTFSLHANDLDR